MPPENRDTVEEFWDKEVLDICIERAQSTSTSDFMDALCAFLNTRGPMWPAPSGRLALQRFLQAVLPPGKQRILACSFNCPVVAEAIVKAGFELETFDLGDETGDINWESVGARLREDHGALVIPHLFGVPTDFRAVLKPARENGTLVIEDCAPTLGGRIEGTMAGTLGDAAFFSFNFDKPISLGGGGALLVNNESLASVIPPVQDNPSLETEVSELQSFLAYLRQRRSVIRHVPSPLRILARRLAAPLRAHRCPQPAALPFPVSGIGPLRAALGLWQLERYAAVVERRNANAALFSEAACRTWHVGATVSPAWLRQKVLPPLQGNAQALSRRLRREGLRVGNYNWPNTLDTYLHLPEKKHAGYIAKESLDVPIHQNMTRIELELIYRTLCEGVSP